MVTFLGHVYHFCAVCTVLLGKVPGVDLFLRSDCSQNLDIPFTSEERDLLGAKERRVKGKILWSQKNP